MNPDRADKELPVDPVTLIVTALAAGAATGVSDAASTAIRDAYQGLKRLVAARFSGRRAAEVALDEHEADPDTWREPLVRALETSGVAADPDVLVAARQLLISVDPEGGRAGKYTIDLRGAQGVQAGDHNVQLNQFTTPPSQG
jgi:hypothetical protein